MKTALIVDIDGTLSHNVSGRGWFDYDRVGEDQVDTDLRDLLDMVDPDTEIIICTGREESCREVTEKWLADNGVAYDYLYMRKLGDRRPDDEVKREVYEEAIKGEYRVMFVLEDRDQVVKMWRSLGLKCWQVAEGDF